MENAGSSSSSFKQISSSHHHNRENVEEILKKFCKQHLVFDQSFPVEELIKSFCKDQSLSLNDNKQAGKTGLALIEEVDEEEESSKLLRRKNPTLTSSINHKLLTQSDESVNQEGVDCSELKKFDCSVSNSPRDDAVTQRMSLEDPDKEKNKRMMNVDQPSNQMINSEYSSTGKMKRLTCNDPHLLALGELEFKKMFLILSCCGKEYKLEDFISVDEIRRMKSLHMGHFETRLRTILGDDQYVKQTDRTKKLDWDSEKTFVYHCYVEPDGSYTFKGPYLQRDATHLHRVLGDDNVLLVKFSGNEGDRDCSSSPVYHRIGKEGILVGLRRFQFFVFKDGGKEQKKKQTQTSSFASSVKCYFVCLESSGLHDKSVSEARSHFMHIHNISSMPKYMPRLSLILSKTTKIQLDFASVNIEIIKDQPCLDQNGNTVRNQDGDILIHTDGTGFISEDLALLCQRNVRKGKYTSLDGDKRVLDRNAAEEKPSDDKSIRSYTGDPPLLTQCRLFYDGAAAKGTLLVNKKLPFDTIQIRPSMIKVESDPKLVNAVSANSLEIVTTSNKPKNSCLSKYLLALLAYGGVPQEYFMNLLTKALEDAQNVHYNKHAALTVALRYSEMDNFLVPRMILSGIPIDEPYLQDRLRVLMNEEKKSLMGGKLPVSECYYLMGTVDPTGILNRDEVCVILEDGQLSGNVLVYKNPGLHFGDVHVMKATYIEELVNFVGNAKYAIFFPTKGPRSVADEIANSDFDGDMYWVSRNPQLLESFKPSSPWEQKYTAKSVRHRKPTDFSPGELEDELFQQFLTTRFNPSYSMGVAADCWLAYMDRLLTLSDDCTEEKKCMKEKMLQLTDIYYDALDAPKTGKKVEVPSNLRVGKYPHYLEKSNLGSYQSRSILGLIFDKVASFKTTQRLEANEVRKLPAFDGGEIPTSCVRLWEERYDQYRSEMTDALNQDDDVKDDYAEEVNQKYKQMLYEAPELNESTRIREEIYNEALAIYNIVYDYARIKGVGRCGFAWKVAGQALCEFYAKKLDEDPIICTKSVLSELFI
ncbi:hypothetical protein C5167_019794 [Papaver somniferum]|uniref:RNA-dependent RNA polymerase n=2 Tax=Papaver somniferum TaxID=3469 RepID=A0A4Y7IR64_PAPSO|nr:hypothetical protein C5167_019794 [Papaver somniferum]